MAVLRKPDTLRRGSLASCETGSQCAPPWPCRYYNPDVRGNERAREPLLPAPFKKCEAFPAAPCNEIPGSAEYLSGFLLDVAMGSLIITSFWPLRRAWFELFYSCHALSIVGVLVFGCAQPSARGADVVAVDPVPLQMWQRQAAVSHLCRRFGARHYFAAVSTL